MLSIRREILDKKLEASKSLIHGNVLDIGGKKHNKRGSFVPPKNENTKWTYINLDSSTSPDILGSCENLPFKDDTFDTVVMTEVLEYVFNPEYALLELERISKSTANILVSIPFLNSFHGDYKYDLRRYTASGIRHLVGKSNLEIISIERMGSIGSVIFDLFRTNLYNSTTSICNRFLFQILKVSKTLFYKIDSFQDEKNFYITTGYFLILRKP